MVSYPAALVYIGFYGLVGVEIANEFGTTKKYAEYDDPAYRYNIGRMPPIDYIECPVCHCKNYVDRC